MRDLELAGPDDVSVGLGLAAEGVVEGGHCRLVVGVDEQSVDGSDELIAGRALNLERCR